MSGFSRKLGCAAVAVVGLGLAAATPARAGGTNCPLASGAAGQAPGPAALVPRGTADPALPLAKRVQVIVAEQLGALLEKVVATAAFYQDLGADSLDIVELTMALEAAFDVDIDDRDCETLRTVGDVVAYLEKRLGASPR